MSLLFTTNYSSTKRHGLLGIGHLGSITCCHRSHDSY